MNLMNECIRFVLDTGINLDSVNQLTKLYGPSLYKYCI